VTENERGGNTFTVKLVQNKKSAWPDWNPGLAFCSSLFSVFSFLLFPLLSHLLLLRFFIHHDEYLF
jgi:hypothetical protein